MNTSHLLSWFVLVNLMLTACGGGGSSGKPPSSAPSTNSSIAVSSVTSSSSVTPTTQLTIRGAVAAGALAGGEVDVVIAGKSHKTLINDKGEYQITLDVANSDINRPFTAIATGMGSNQWVQLAALYPSIAKLLALAGGDRVLDATEFLAVNISPMTTAEYSVVVGKKLPVDSDAERNYALLQITAAEQLDRAALMQRTLAAAKSDLSSKYNTTLDMFLDYEYSRGKAEILRLHEALYRNEVVKLLADPLQVRVSSTPLQGKFVLQGWEFNYLLDIKENGTGHIRPSNWPYSSNVAMSSESYQESSFTWVRKGTELKITFNKPIQYVDIPNQLCEFGSCSIKMNSLSISLIADTEVGRYVNVSFDEERTDSAGVISALPGEPIRAALLDMSHFYKLSSDELIGYEWYTNGFSYVFNADGTAVQINHADKTETIVNWQLNDGAITMDGGILTLLPIYPDGPGFIAMQLLAPRGNPGFTDKTLKPAPFWRRYPVNMAESDWVGRWNRVSNHSFYAAIDYYSDYVFRDGFETQALGSWSVISNSHVRGFSNGLWRMEYELLAIRDGLHYMQYCYGYESANFAPSNCLLEAHFIDKTFTGTTFWEIWSNPLFEEVNSSKAWKFTGDKLKRDDMAQSSYYRISANMIYLANYHSVLEMLSSTKDSIKVCEYDAFSSCEHGTIYTLKRGIEIKVNIVGKGYIEHHSEGLLFASGSGSFMSARNRTHWLMLQSESGRKITAGDISGCEGWLEDNYYTISARDTDCELTVNFQ